MARTTERKTEGTFLDRVRDSPATHLLTTEAKTLLDNQAARIVNKAGDGVNAATRKLGDVRQAAKLPALGEGVKRVVQGGHGVKSTRGATTSAVAGRVKSLVPGVSGKGRRHGKDQGNAPPKAINVEESIDIGLPVATVYEQWTQFKEFSRFAKGIESVEQRTDTETAWRGKVFKSRRTWTATILEQVPDRRIVWTSEGAKGSVNGVVTFHPLADDLTRVLVVLEYFPQGFVEKTGNLWRAAGRRTRLDLKNFRRFVMLRGEPTGAWRGEVRDGKVVKGPDDPRAQSRRSSDQGKQPRKAAPAARNRNTGSAGRPRKATSSRKDSASASNPRKATSTRSTSAGSRSQSAGGKTQSSRAAAAQRPRKRTTARTSTSARQSPAAKKAPARKRS
jgi:uncharacterized membrane protein